MARKFPKTLFVKIDGNAGEEYFDAHEDMYVLCEKGDKIKIATYQLVETTEAEVVLRTSKSKR